jgi:hypothetical protein
VKLSKAVSELEQRVNDLECKLQSAIIAKEKAQKDASWYRAKLLGFVTTRWIKQERESDGV